MKVLFCLSFTVILGSTERLMFCFCFDFFSTTKSKLCQNLEFPIMSEQMCIQGFDKVFILIFLSKKRRVLIFHNFIVASLHNAKCFLHYKGHHLTTGLKWVQQVLHNIHGRHCEFEPGKVQYSTSNFFDWLFLIGAY